MSREDKNFNSDTDFSELSIDELLASVYRDLEETAPPQTEPAVGTEGGPYTDVPEFAPPAGAPQETERAPAGIAVAERPAPPQVVDIHEVRREREGRVEQEEAREEDIPVRRRSRFVPGLLIFSAVILLVMAVGLTVFWKYLESYELSQPEHAVESFLSSVDDDYWREGILSASRIHPTVFEQNPEQELEEEFYLNAVLGGELDWRRMTSEYTDEVPVYVLRAGEIDFCRLELGEGGDVGFGFSGWKVTEARLLEEFLDRPTLTVEITAPLDSTVTINGVEADESFLHQSVQNYEDLYRIEGLYHEPEVSVTDRDGGVLEPLQAENGVYLYPIPEAESYSFRITAPAGAVVLVDGEDVSERFTPETVIPEVFGEDILDYADDSASMDVYDFEGGFYEPPTVTATDAQGRELSGVQTEDGNYVFAAISDEELEEEHRGRVENFFRAYVDFSANIGNNSTANFYKISPLILPDSDLYAHISAAVEPMTWVGGATVTYNTLEIGGFIPHGDDCFTCLVSYSLTNETYYDVRELEGVYDLVFVRSNGVWYAASMLEAS